MDHWPRRILQGVQYAFAGVQAANADNKLAIIAKRLADWGNGATISQRVGGEMPSEDH